MQLDASKAYDGFIDTLVMKQTWNTNAASLTNTANHPIDTIGAAADSEGSTDHAGNGS